MPATFISLADQPRAGKEAAEKAHGCVQPECPHQTLQQEHHHHAHHQDQQDPLFAEAAQPTNGVTMNWPMLNANIIMLMVVLGFITALP